MVSASKKLKLFNKVLKEFLIDFNSLQNGRSTVLQFKVENSSILNSFRDEISFSIDKFLDCDETVFEQISLCKKIGLNNIDSETVNRVKIWTYIHNLYIITLEKDKEDFLEKSKKSLEKLENSKLKSSIAIPNEMNNLISDISIQLTKSLEGKDLSNLNPMDLMSSLLSGNSTSNGIDFGSILQQATKTINDKVESGELDLNKLKEQASSMIGTIRNPELNKEVKEHLHLKK